MNANNQVAEPWAWCKTCMTRTFHHFDKKQNAFICNHCKQANPCIDCHGHETEQNGKSQFAARYGD